MNKILKQLAIDAVLYTLIFLAAIRGSEYAENILSFLIVAFGAMATLALVSLNAESIKEMLEKQGKDATNLSLRYYGRISTSVEVSIFASQGWYWMAGLWFTGLLLSFRISEVYDDLYGKPKII